MNILPKKNWHVRKKENIAKVRRDEAEAAEKEKEEQRRAKLAEQEVRLAFLRSKARQTFHPDNEEISKSVIKEKPEGQNKTTGNINFFQEEESGILKAGTNKEHEEEKKKEKEDYEKKIGLLTYLGQDTLEATGGKEWFVDDSKLIVKKGRSFVDDEIDDEVEMKRKMRIDPLKDIAKYTDLELKLNSVNKTIINTSTHNALKLKSILHKKKHKKEKSKLKKHKKRKRGSDDDSELPPPSKRVKKRKSKKCKHQKHKVSKDASPASSLCSDEEQNCKADMLARLRLERKHREEVERKRAERLLAGKDPDLEEKPKEKPLPYNRKYNSQFNPHLAKQNKEPKILQSGTKYWLS